MKKRGSTKTKLLKAFLPIIFFGSVTAGVYFGCFYRKGDEHKPKHEESLSDTSEVPTPTRIGPAVTTVNSFVPTSSFASFGSVTNGNTGLVPNPTLKTAFSTFTNDAWTPLPTVTTVVINSPVAVRNPWDVSVFEKSE
ncbi:hypothetical protein M7I_5920 [Glarea lozoyensis 74030]|nr:hypothetical protein M7I_5920 [Glarea lozoyensis 74030]